MSRRIVLTGGLSGGHTYPLIAVAQALRKLSAGQSTIEFLYIGSKGPFEQEAMEREGIPVKFVVTAKWRRYFSILNFIDCFKFPWACLQALWYLLIAMPDAVFSKGGAASVPVAFAAWVYRIPILLHDSDAVAGRANRIIAKFAQRIAIAYEYARRFFPAKEVMLTGNPIREAILTGDANRARERYALSPEKPTILIMGGSQGAHYLNHAIIRVLPDLLREHYQVLHLTGEVNLEEVERSAGEIGVKPNYEGYYPISFVEAAELGDLYAVADLIISRAGAGSIAEIAAVKKPAILVPLASAANDEQRMNAFEIAESGGALVLEEQNLGVHILISRIKELMANPTLRQTMAEKMSHFYHPDAATVLAKGIISML